MDSNINYAIEDGTNLSKTVDEQLTLLNAEGFDEENNTKLKAAVADLAAKEKAQSGAVNETEKKTAAKDKVIKKTHILIQRLREAAKGAFLDDPKKLKQFKIDEQIPKGTNSLHSLCEYLSPIVEAEKSELLKNGFNQADIDNLAAAGELVLNAGSDRKRVLKLQKSATIVRNDAADLVQKLTRKIRRFVKARFAEKPEVLVLFESTSKGRGSAGGEDEKPPENPPAGEEPKK